MWNPNKSINRKNLKMCYPFHIVVKINGESFSMTQEARENFIAKYGNLPNEKIINFLRQHYPNKKHFTSEDVSNL